MSGNKKCHSHLSNSHIIHFITHIFQSKFHETYPSRAENDSHRRTIKTILHILTRLIHDSSVGQEILENHFLPIFSKIDAKHSFSFTGSLNDKDLSFITKQMSETINQKLAASAASATSEGGSAANNKIKFNISRQESYVWGENVCNGEESLALKSNIQKLLKYKYRGTRRSRWNWHLLLRQYYGNRNIHT